MKDYTASYYLWRERDSMMFLNFYDKVKETAKESTASNLILKKMDELLGDLFQDGLK